jgi:hypothetical protein
MQMATTMTVRQSYVTRHLRAIVVAGLVLMTAWIVFSALGAATQAGDRGPAPAPAPALVAP